MYKTHTVTVRAPESGSLSNFDQSEAISWFFGDESLGGNENPQSYYSL